MCVCIYGTDIWVPAGGLNSHEAGVISRCE